MSFLAPLFLAGAMAVALPIVFHLIRRTSREKTIFSSLMFLMPTPPRVTRRSRLENIFLLLLRCLVLCLLALGFARPFIQRPLANDAKAGAAKKTVILLDSSASMRRANLWPDARTKAEEVLRQASPVDQVAIFTFDRQLHRVITFEQWSGMGASERVPFAMKRLGELSPGWAATHLGSALVNAAEAFEESSGSQQENFAVRQIILISDLQEGSALETLQAYEWPKGIELRIEPVKTRRPTNAGIQIVTETAEAEKADDQGGPRVRVSNSSDSKREQFQIGWARAGQVGFLGPALDVYVPPGQSRTVQAPKSAPGLAGDRMALAGDDEDFDNVVYLAPPRAEQLNVWFFGQDSEKDPAQCLYYLKRAFQQTRLQAIQVNAWLPTAGAVPQIENAPLIISTDGLPDGQLKALGGVLKSGKMVLLVLKDAHAGARTISYLAGVDGVGVEEAPASNYAMLGQIDFEHPLFAPFASARFSDFTKIHFWKHRRLNLEKIRDAKILARFDDGDPALIQMGVGTGTLLVLTSGWEPADSQLALSSKFVPLLYSILEQSGGIKSQLAQYLVGDTVVLAGPDSEASTNQTLTIRKPDGSQVELPKGDKFSQTDLPGIYVVASNPSRQFAVNLDPAESRTGPLPLEELERLGVPVKVQVAESAAQLQKRRQHLQAAELEQQQKLWRWLIVAALVVLVGETLLAGWLTRRTILTHESASG